MKKMTRSHCGLGLETANFRLAPAPLHQDARIHLKHNAQGHYESRAFQSSTPACGRLVRQLPLEGRDTHSDSLGARINPLFLGNPATGIHDLAKDTLGLRKHDVRGLALPSHYPNPSMRHSRDMSG